MGAMNINRINRANGMKTTIKQKRNLANKTSYLLASQFGREAYKKGIIRAPFLDTEFYESFKDSIKTNTATKFNANLFTSWLAGWDIENINDIH
jgi:hypothetical protein